MTEKSKLMAVLFKNMDRSLIAQYKATCAQRGYTMTDVFTALVEDYVRSPQSYHVLRKQERRHAKNRQSIYGRN